MEGDSISISIILFCIVMSAYFSATETAFSSLSRVRIKNMAEKGDKKAQLVLDLSENYDKLLSTILIGNNVVNILSASLATTIFIKMLGNDVGSGVATLVTTIVVLIFGEISPKSIAKESPEKLAMFSAPFLKILIVVLTPFNFLFGQWKKLLSHIFKAEDNSGITEEELLTIVEEAQQDGEIDEQEGSLIKSAMEFTEQEAEDILTPRIDISGIPENATVEEIAEMFSETGYSRLPVYRETIDHIVGIIYQKDFYNKIFNKETSITSIIRPALFITQSKKIGELLQELQREKLHIAVVVDEYGGTVGLVTLEDILEELVGEIWDEHDEVTQDIVKISDMEYEVLGCADVEELFELFGKEEDLEIITVSGWVMEMLERVPEKGDSFVYEDMEVTVLEMDEKRVEKVKIKFIESEEQKEEK